MKPIEYIEQLMLTDVSAKKSIDALRYGTVTADEAVVMFMSHQKQRADAYEAELINIAYRSCAPRPIEFGGKVYEFHPKNEHEPRS